jgi:phosphatidylglycerophosphatase A
MIATFFGAGFLRPGPGTWTSAITAALWFAAELAVDTKADWLGTAIAAAVITVIGIPACTRVEAESGKRDPGFAVIDEVAGQLIALIGVPAQWKYVLASFILFRGFDIFKPPPLRRLERLPGGAGIMLDDVGAGAYVVILIQVWLRLFAATH